MKRRARRKKLCLFLMSICCFMVLGQILNDVGLLSKNFMQEHDVLISRRLDDEEPIRFVANTSSRAFVSEAPNALSFSDSNRINGIWKIYSYRDIDGKIENFPESESFISKFEMIDESTVRYNDESNWKIAFLREDQNEQGKRIVLFSEMYDEKGQYIGFERLEARFLHGFKQSLPIEADKKSFVAEDEVNLKDSINPGQAVFGYTLISATSPGHPNIPVNKAFFEGSMRFNSVERVLSDLFVTITVKNPVRVREGSNETQEQVYEELLTTEIEVSDAKLSNNTFLYNDFSALASEAANDEFRVTFVGGPYDKVKLIFKRNDAYQVLEEQNNFYTGDEGFITDEEQKDTGFDGEGDFTARYKKSLEEVKKQEEEQQARRLASTIELENKVLKEAVDL